MASVSFDPEAKYAQLGERVDNQGSRITNLETVVSRGFDAVASQIRGVSDDLRSGSKTQWPIIIGFSSITITVLGGLGFMALQPTKDNVAQLREDFRQEQQGTKDSLSEVVKAMVTQQELKWRTDRSLEDRTRIEGAIKDIRDAQVPREEMQRVWTADDQQKASLQRQIDEIKQAQGATYSTRDVILDLRERLDRVERQRPPAG